MLLVSARLLSFIRLFLSSLPHRSSLMYMLPALCTFYGIVHLLSSIYFIYYLLCVLFIFVAVYHCMYLISIC